MRKGIGAALVIAAAACAPSPEPGNGADGDDDAVRACTMIGCESGLTVRLGAGLQGATAIEVSGPGEPTQRAECGPARPCADGVFFRDFTAGQATVRVTLAGRVVTREVTPTWRDVQPNGEGCPPTCRQGEVVVSDGAGEDPPERPSPRAATIEDTVMLEGNPEPMTLRLFRPAGDFPLPFSTYVPEFLTGSTVTPGEPPEVRFTPANPTDFTRTAVISFVVYPAGTTEAQARGIARGAAADRGTVTDLERPHAYAADGWRFRGSGTPGAALTGWVELGRRGDRWFHILVQYPAEMGDGMGPRVVTILEHWRWEPSGERLRL